MIRIHCLNKLICKFPLQSSYLKNTFYKNKLQLTRFSTQKGDNMNEQRKQKIKNILNKIIINVKDENKSIIDAGIVSSYRVQQQGKKAIIGVNMAKDFARVKNLIKSKVLNEGFQDVQVVLQQKQDKKIFERKGNLSQIKKIIAVSSCKGGVGKSTVAVNVAFGLKQQGFKVGIFDADVYGPSLPTLVNKEGELLESALDNANMLLPKQVDGVKCMSFGFVANQPAAMRGPMASSIISQLILQTKWQNLDYLIIDLPPGTGDVNLNICQQVKLDGAIIITTPQRLSFIDVLKGIKMFQDLRVRILAIVQNMSYYSCSKCKTIDQIFGKGHNKIIQEQLGIQNSFRLPLISQVSKLSDIGKLPVLVLPEQHIIRQTYMKICVAVKKQLQKPKNKAGVFYNTAERLVIVQQDKKQKKIDPIILRTKCKCNQCMDEITGQSKVNIKQIDPQVYPIRVQEKGNYAVGIVWSDGHKNSIYSFQRLFSQEIPQKNK